MINHNYKIKSWSISEEGDARNHLKEDDYIIDEHQLFFMVTDGITRPLYDPLNPGRTSFNDYQDNKHFSYDVAQIMCKKTLEFLPHHSIQEALILANKKVNDYYKKEVEPYYLNDFKSGKYEEKTFEKPGCCGACVYIQNNQLFYTNFGDCVVILIRNNEKILLTPKQNEEAVKTYDTFENRRDYVNYYVNKSVQNGYAIANGDEVFKELLNIKKLEIKPNDIFYLCSDGLYDFLMNADPSVYQNWCNMKDFIDAQRKLDINKGHRYSDDMTLIKIIIGL